MENQSPPVTGLIVDRAGKAPRRPRLLVVDDEPVNIHAVYQVFAADFQVFMATTGEQALALCVSKQPDLVLLDLMMPGMDGYEVCRRLKDHADTCDIPVIIVTARNDETSETRGLDAGAVDFIAKPINPKIVRARVGTQMTRKVQADMLRQWVYIDGLTGLHNRRFFDERFPDEWGRAVRNGSQLSVLLLDVDLFKRYNDRYGHLMGDECLRRVASALKMTLRRPGDLMARYGGEEFVCLLPGVDLDGALEIANQLGQKVQELQIEHADSDVAQVVTVSLGVCSKRRDALFSDADELLRQADAQLYRAKALGRNRACGAESVLP